MRQVVTSTPRGTSVRCDSPGHYYLSRRHPGDLGPSSTCTTSSKGRTDPQRVPRGAARISRLRIPMDVAKYWHTLVNQGEPVSSTAAALRTLSRSPAIRIYPVRQIAGGPGTWPTRRRPFFARDGGSATPRSLAQFVDGRASCCRDGMLAKQFRSRTQVNQRHGRRPARQRIHPASSASTSPAARDASRRSNGWRPKTTDGLRMANGMVFPADARRRRAPDGCLIGSGR